MSRGLPCVLCVGLVVAAAPSAAQEPGATPPGLAAARPTRALAGGSAGPAFRSGVDLVALTVTVTDAERRFVGNLTAEDFQVFEDGVQQPVSFFGLADVPIDVALLVDGSASMREVLPLVRDAARGLLRTLRPGDRAALVEFRNTVRIAQPMTPEVARVEEAIARVTAAGGTSLHNALYVTLREFQAQARQQADLRRRAIVVLSDGEDTGSLVSFDEVLDMARRSGVTIYTVGLKNDFQLLHDRMARRGRRYFSQADYSMRTLASETGAQAFFPDTPSDLKAIYDTVAAEMATQYALGYVSRNPIRNGAWRRLVVRVTAAVQGARPRTRTGYFADTK